MHIFLITGNPTVTIGQNTYTQNIGSSQCSLISMKIDI